MKDDGGGGLTATVNLEKIGKRGMPSTAHAESNIHHL